MEDIFTYQILIRGSLGCEDVAAFGPREMHLEATAEHNTLLVARTDQAGLIGLLRHLHGSGRILLSIHTTPPPQA